MSQVKNLRAMFEHKGDDSPADKAAGGSSDRGRSPAESSEPATPSRRPLSKVRTSFVAVEKDGKVGLKRDPSSDSIPTTRSLSQRRLSTNTEEDFPSVFSDKSNMASAPEPIPESPRQPEGGSSPSKANGANGHSALHGELGAVTDQPSHNPDHHVDEELSTPKLLPADPSENPKAKPIERAFKATHASSGPKSTKVPATDASKLPSKQSSKLEPVSTKQPVSTSKISAKSPALSKTSAGIPKSASGPLPVRTSNEPTKKPSRTSMLPAAAKPTTKPAGSATTSVSKKPTPAPVNLPSSSSTGFVKPKPKSPTRPVNLPSSLMAGTASSQSKVRDGSRESPSGRPPPTQSSSLGRSPSRASTSTTTGTTTTKTVRRQRSTIHPRPSIGPPPAKAAAHDDQATKKEREVDDSFLARMSRPTQSSASKVHEKTPVTPPRKGSAPKKDASTARASSAATSGRKAPAQSTAAATGSPGPKKPTTDEAVTEKTPSEAASAEKADIEEALREATEVPDVEIPDVEERAPAGAPSADVLDEVSAPAPKVEETVPKGAVAEVVDVEKPETADEAPSAVEMDGPEATSMPAVAEETQVGSLMSGEEKKEEEEEVKEEIEEDTTTQGASVEELQPNQGVELPSDIEAVDRTEAEAQPVESVDDITRPAEIATAPSVAAQAEVQAEPSTNVNTLGPIEDPGSVEEAARKEEAAEQAETQAKLE